MDESDLSEIVRITEVITDYVLYLKENMDKASLFREGKYILGEYDETGNYTEYIKKYDDFFSTHTEAYDISIVYHEADLKRISNNCKKTADAWEVDSFYFPTLVNDEDDVFFPAILMVVDLQSRMIIGQHMTHPYNTEEFQLAFIEVMVNTGIIPEKVIVKYNPELFVLYDIFDELNIEVEVVDSLQLIPQIKKDMINSLLQ